MSERNREHFDIEAADHLDRLRYYPEEAAAIHQSILYRIQIHKTGNAFLAPPMLFADPNESFDDHLKREYDKGGYNRVPLSDAPVDTSETPKTPSGAQSGGFASILKASRESENEKSQQEFLLDGLNGVNLPL